MTLRRRTGEADAPLDAGELQAPPAALLDLVRSIVRHSPITAVATLRTSRHVHRVLDATGAGGRLGQPHSSHQPRDERVASQHVPVVRVERGGVHPNQHVGTDLGQVGVHQLHHVRRAERLNPR
jgi:hypothetical protein